MKTLAGPPVALSLGPTYPPDLWDLRKRVTAERRQGAGGVIVVALSAPITSPVIEIAILAGSLYLIGVRRQGGQWFEFRPDVARSRPGAAPATPLLAGSRWITRGSRPALSSYRALGLVEAVERKEAQHHALTYRGQPNKLLAEFGSWDGTLNSADQRLAMCLLIFVVCESLRFRSIENACARWIRQPGTLAAGSEFVFTAGMIETVQNWKATSNREREAHGGRDVWTALPDEPDPLDR